MDYNSIDIRSKYKLFSEQWQPKVIAKMNDYQFKIAKIEGEFTWHSHKNTDETFIVIKGEIDIILIVFYLGAIFWTLGYDTIYGYQDIKDDEIIGLKSTSIKFKKNPYTFLYICYSIFALTLLTIGHLMKLNNFYYFFFTFIVFQTFYLQLKKLNIKNASSCLNIFKSNNFLGLLVFLTIVIGKI